MYTSFTVTSGGNVIRGEYSCPASAGKHTCLILGHGFTGNRNERLLITISKKLLEYNICCIRFDYDGHGESDGATEDVTVAKEVQDLSAVLDYAQTLDFVDKDRIYIGGHSVGGLTPVLLYEKRAAEIAGLVLLSPALSLYHEFVMTLTGERLLAMANGQSIDFGSFRLGRAIIDECCMMNAFEVAAGIRPKALLLHGKEDLDTPAFNSIELKRLWKDNAVLCLIPDADHCYLSSKATNMVAEKTAQWLSGSLSE